MSYCQNRKLQVAMLIAAGFPSVLLANNVEGRWGQQFGMPVIPLSATLLPDGQVFSFGTRPDGLQGAGFEYSIWNFWAGQGAQNLLPNRTASDIFCSGFGLLPSGDVLVAGGDVRNPEGFGITDSSILSFGSKDFNRTANMANARWYPSMVTLPNGENLVMGGIDGAKNPVQVPEVYGNGHYRSLWGAANGGIINNDEGKWFYPRNWVAPNGRVFGLTGNVMYFVDWGGDGGTQIVGNLPNKTRSHTSTAVMYQPGKILQVGGTTNGDTQSEGSRQAITVDVTSGNPVVQDVQDMGFRRVWANSTVLPNGEVLVTGGSAWENKLIDTAQTAEMWNPNSRQFRRLATAATARLYHSTALLLPDASVMVGGGGSPGPLNNLNAEIYYPPYLFHGNEFAQRPTIGDFNIQQGYNNRANIGFGGAGGVSRVTLVRQGAVTHSFDMGQRFIELGFQNMGNGTVDVSMPNTPNVAPPGYYMLFFMNNEGVPSMAKIIHLDGGNGSNNGAVGHHEPVQPHNPDHGVAGAPHAGDIYTISARSDGKCLDIPWGKPDSGLIIQQVTCNGTQAQKFRLQDAGHGNYSLVNVQTNKCVDVQNWSVDNGGKLLQWDCTGGANQTVHVAPGHDGAFQVIFNHSNKCLDIPGASDADGLQLQQWECAGVANQEFFFNRQ